MWLLTPGVVIRKYKICSGLTYGMSMFGGGLGWFRGGLGWFGVFWGGLGCFNGPSI